jgi:hypothetical protein
VLQPREQKQQRAQEEQNRQILKDFLEARNDIEWDMTYMQVSWLKGRYILFIMDIRLMNC